MNGGTLPACVVSNEKEIDVTVLVGGPTAEATREKQSSHTLVVLELAPNALDKCSLVHRLSTRKQDHGFSREDLVPQDSASLLQLLGANIIQEVAFDPQIADNLAPGVPLDAARRVALFPVAAKDARDLSCD